MYFYQANLPMMCLMMPTKQFICPNMTFYSNHLSVKYNLLYLPKPSSIKLYMTVNKPRHTQKMLSQPCMIWMCYLITFQSQKMIQFWCFNPDFSAVI